MPNQKNEWNLQGNVTKKEFKVLYDALKCAKIHLSTGPNAITVLRMLFWFCCTCARTGLLPTGP